MADAGGDDHRQSEKLTTRGVHAIVRSAPSGAVTIEARTVPLHLPQSGGIVKQRPPPPDVDTTLLGAEAESYGALHQQHRLSQYELYVEMADRISARRHAANTFFLTVNTVLVAFLGMLASEEASDAPLLWVLAVASAGATLSYYWYRSLTSYRDLNGAKFRVIHAIERDLPLRLYDAEWESVGRGVRPDLYLPLTHVELRVPWVFCALYGALALWRVVSAIG
jgi:hypothetical protein